jgi:YD repeat-containing protein
VVTSPGDHTITYSFDPVGNRAQMIDPDGGRTTYSYNAVRALEVLDVPGEILVVSAI